MSDRYVYRAGGYFEEREWSFGVFTSIDRAWEVAYRRTKELEAEGQSANPCVHALKLNEETR